MVKLLVCEKVCIGVDTRLDSLEISTTFCAKPALSETKVDISIVPYYNRYVLCVYADDKEFVEHVDGSELLFKLCIAIEDVIVSKLCENFCSYAIIHSGCVKVYNNNMLVVGQKESGKSTLISYLSTKVDFEYICDDSTVLTTDSCFGAQIPIRLRKIFVDGNNMSNMSNITSKSSDGINVRYLFNPINNPLCEKFKPTHIIFPKYASCDSPSMLRIEAIDTFRMLIENTKAWSSPNDLYRIARLYAKSIPAYKIRYNNIECAYFMMEEINGKTYEK